MSESKGKTRGVRWCGLAGLVGLVAALPACGLICYIFVILAIMGGSKFNHWIHLFGYHVIIDAEDDFLTAGGTAAESLRVVGKKEYGEFGFFSKIAHEGKFDACLTIRAENLSAHLPFASRAALRIAPEGSPPSGYDGFGVEARTDAAASSWFVAAFVDGAPLPNPVALDVFETIVLRVEQTATTRRYLVATETDATKQQWTQILQTAAGPPAGRQVFGGAARGLGKNGGFRFRSLRIGGVQYGGEAEVAIISEVGGAMDLLREAMTALETGAEGAPAAESKLEQALAALNDAADSLELAELGPDVEGKLAAKALKRARSKAKVAMKKADKVADKGKGSTKKARKKTKAAIARATVAVGNLLGVETKKASASLADAVVVGSEQ